MKCKVQVVTTSDDGQESIRELACIEREDLTAETLGLSVADSKALLQSLQEVVVEWQMNTYLESQRHCPDCSKLRHSKGTHHIAFRTVFGTIPVQSPRLEHCSCQVHNSQSFSPLTALLPEHTTPERLYLESKWAALASYGMTVKMLEDVLPMSEPLQPVTIRNHVLKLAERLEDELGEEQGGYIKGCPRDWCELPIPDGPLTVGIDGSYVKAQGMEQNVFEVIAGKSIVAFRRDEEVSEPSSQAFAFVQTDDEKPRRRLFEHLQAHGLQMNQQIEFLSDGGDDVRDVQLYLSPEADHLLDWWHVTSRITTLTQTAKGLPERSGEGGRSLRTDVLRELERIKWFLWHGNVFKALPLLRSVESDLEDEEFTSGNATARKLYKAVCEFTTYIANNRGFIPNYGERYRNCERINTG
jgi:hypothetical protein